MSDIQLDTSNAANFATQLVASLRPSNVADQFGVTPPVSPSGDGGAVVPATTASPANIIGTNTTWGQEIPELFGTCQIIGLPLWTSQPSYADDGTGNTTLTIDFAVVFGRIGPNSGGASVRTVNFDGTPLITYDPTTKQVTTINNFNYTFYDGTQTVDDIDPTIAAVEGAFTPAFLGLVYMVLPGFVSNNGTNFPQVVAEMHMDEESAPTGALVDPIAYANTRDTAGGKFPYLLAYDVDWKRGILYCYRSFTTGDDDTGKYYYADAYDINAKSFIQRVRFDPPSGVKPSFGKYLNTDGTIIYAFVSFTQLIGFSSGDGSEATLIATLTNHFSVFSTFWATNTVAYADEVLFSGEDHLYLSVIERDGSSLAETNVIYIPTDTGFPAGTNNVIGWTSQFDYSNTNADFGNMCCAYSWINGSTTMIIRVIATNANSNRRVGIAYLKDPTTGNYYSETMKRGPGSYHLMSWTDGSSIKQMWTNDAGTQLYVIVDDETRGKTYFQCYNLFYDLFNANTDPKAATMSAAELASAGDFEYCALNYERVLQPSGFAGIVFGDGCQRRRKGSLFVVAINPTGLFLFNITNGSHSFHPNGNWTSLPADGGVSYGGQNFPNDLIWDDVNKAVFYVGMASGFDDYPGRAFVANATPGPRPDYLLSDALRDLSELAGFDPSVINVADVPDVIVGMAINKAVGFTDLISQICAAFRVDVIETPDFGLRFRKLTNPPNVDFTIVPNDCCVLSNGELVDITYAGLNQIPNILQIAYVDPDQEYVVALANAKRTVYPAISVTGKTIVQISIPIVMTEAQAAYTVGFAIFDMWSGALTMQVTLPTRYALVECGDVCNITLTTGRIVLAVVSAMTYNTDRSVSLSLTAIQVNRFTPRTQGPHR